MDVRVTNDAYELTVTVDCAIFGFSKDQLQILLAKRGIPPYQDTWVLPGGILQQDQTLGQAAENVLKTLVGVNQLFLEQIKTYSDINRHPVKRVMTVCYFALVRPENHQLIPQSYAIDAHWWPINEMPGLGFDHDQLYKDAIDRLREEIKSRPLGFELLPAKFTLKELQGVYENILQQKLDRRNFRRKVHAIDLLVDTKEKKNGVKGGPNLFRFNKEKYHKNPSFPKNNLFN